MTVDTMNAMKRKPGLDLLRAVAVIWVMVFHSYIAGYMAGGVLRWSGWMGVDLFFALSGFLIGSQIFTPLARGRRLDFGDFYLRRAFRTLPAYFVVLAVYLAFPSLREAPGMMPVWQFLTYTLNLFIDPSHLAFSHAWSLCVEEQFYLVFPALAALLAARGSLRRSVIAITLLVVAGMALRGELWTHFIDPVRRTGGDINGSYLHLLYYPTYSRLDDLLAGVVLAAMRSYRTHGWTWVERHANAVAAFGLALLITCILCFDGHRASLNPNVFGYPALAIAMMALVAAATCERGVLARLLVPGASWIAFSSYSLYLTHKMVYGQLHGRFAPWVEGHGVWTALLYVACVLGVGAFLYYGVERPFLELRVYVLQRRASRKQGRCEAIGCAVKDMTGARKVPPVSVTKKILTLTLKDICP